MHFFQALFNLGFCFSEAIPEDLRSEDSGAELVQLLSMAMDGIGPGHGVALYQLNSG